MIRPCPNRILCLEESLLNYSSEDVDIPEFFGITYGADGCIGRCVSFISQEDADLCAQRQLVLCENPPCVGPDCVPPPVVLYPNDPQECTVSCPDGGGSFTARVPAGTFIATTLAEANAQALAYACQQAPLRLFCLGPLVGCCCTGTPFSGTLDITGNVPATFNTQISDGALPPGMAFSVLNNQLSVDGTPTVPGNYPVTFEATDAEGNSSTNTYLMLVIGISNTVLPDFTVGVPYSQQLVGLGGSGNYGWRIASGALPDGLTLSESGLISGTPTAGAVTSSATFEVVDLTCEALQKSFFPPRVAMATASTTRIATVRGYSEFTNPSSPPKKYHKYNLSGEAYQWGTAASVGSPNAGWARQVWSSYSEINSAGHEIHQWNDNVYASCNPLPTQWPGFIFLSGSIPFVGYCWNTDPKSCPACAVPPSLAQSIPDGAFLFFANPIGHGTAATQTTYENHRRGPDPAPLVFKGTWSTGTIYVIGDFVEYHNFYWECIGESGPRQPDTNPAFWNPIGSGPPDTPTWDAGATYGAGTVVTFGGNFYVASQESGPAKPDERFDKWRLQDADSIQGKLYDPDTLGPPLTFPITSFLGEGGAWMIIRSVHWVDASLENEYTDAEALANAQVLLGNGNTAENSPRTIGFVSRFTSVAYALACTNLVVGQHYTVTVQFWNTITGATQTRTYNFTAVAETATLNDTVPTPVPGQPVKVQNPTISFTP